MTSLDESNWKPQDHFGQQHRPPLEELDDCQLRPVVEAMAGGPVARFSWQIDLPQQGKKGFYGYKLIPLFSYTTPTGEPGSCRCCLKQISPIESIHYAYLSSYGIPLCTVYGYIPLARNTEIIFLEYLDRIGKEFLDGKAREWFLQVKAQINAVPVDDGYRQQLIALANERPRQEQAVDRAAYYDRLFSLAESGRLGADFFDLCGERQATIPRLLHLADDVEARVREMPLALCNAELDVGHRPGSDVRRCFDLHSTCLSPRFADLRHIIGLPDRVHDGWGDAWLPRERWARIYVEAFNKDSCASITIEDVLRESRVLWLQHALHPGWSHWWLDRALAGEDGARDDLFSVLSYLMQM
jgi:hypothetical protein